MYDIMQVEETILHECCLSDLIPSAARSCLQVKSLAEVADVLEQDYQLVPPLRVTEV
jgi:hypothetical protein